MNIDIESLNLIIALILIAVSAISLLAVKDWIFSKRCPECANRVKSAARRCQFCQHEFAAHLVKSSPSA